MASTSSGTGSVIGAVISRMRRRVSCSLATFRSHLSLKSTSPPAYNVFSVSAAAEFFTRQTVRLLTLLACGRVYLTVLCPSVCPPVCPIYRVDRCSNVRRVYYFGPGAQEVSIDRCTAFAQQQLRAVSRCQLTQEAEHRLMSFPAKRILKSFFSLSDLSNCNTKQHS